MTLSFRHRIRNSSPGGLRPSTLPLGHGGSPQYWLSHVDGEEKNIFFFQTAETGNRAPNSGVKDSGANHYPMAPALWSREWTIIEYNIYSIICCLWDDRVNCIPSFITFSSDVPFYGSITRHMIRPSISLRLSAQCYDFFRSHKTEPTLI